MHQSKKAVSGFMIGLLLLASAVAMAPSINKVGAATIYSSLTYSGQINIAFQGAKFGGTQLAGTAQVTFTLALNQPYGSTSDIQGTATGQGTFAGTYGPSTAYYCDSKYTITASYSVPVSGVTSFLAGKVDLSGGRISNFVETDSPKSPPYPGFCFDLQSSLNSILGDCLGGGSYETNGACHEFSVQGGTNTVTKGTSADFTSVSGTAQLSLVSSTTSSTTTTSTSTSSSVTPTCLGFQITPTMPPPSDPRSFTTGLGSAAFRFNVYWGASLPVKIAFQTVSGDGIAASFAFNPVNMILNPTNVIMNVNTNGVSKGTYPITVTATATNAGLACSATATVSLVVGDTVSDFQLMAHAGQAQLTQVDPTPEGGPATLITDGNNGTATVLIGDNTQTTSDDGTKTSAAATLDVGKNTQVKYYGRVVNLGGEMDKYVFQELQSLLKDKPGTLQQAIDIGWKSVAEANAKVGDVARGVFSGTTKVYGTSQAIGCALASLDTNNHDKCDGTGVIYVIQGQVHYHRAHTPFTLQHLADLILSDHQIIFPLGTELTFNSQPFGNSSLTMLQGSAIVVDLISKQVQIVNASQRVDMTMAYSADPPFSNGQSASLVLGQTGFTTNTATTSQSGLRQPDALSFDAAGNLWVVDANNNRVLEFNPPFANGMSASLVIGQASLSSGFNATSQNGLFFPLDVAFDATGNLWIADSGNSRILRFSPPFTNGMNADFVVGQSSFTTSVGATTRSGLRGPEGIAFDPAGNLWVADRGNNRILEFSTPFSNGMSASLVIGQSTFFEGTSATSQNGLSNPCCVAFDRAGALWEAEWGNNRVMEFAPAFSNGMNAAVVIGQSSFTTSRPVTIQNGLGGPRHITLDASGDLWVADFGGNRVLEFTPPFSNAMNAAAVIGEISFTTNSRTTTQTGMAGAHGVAFDSSGNLWTAEWYNNRVLQFQATKPVSSQGRISTTSPDSIPQWWDSRLSYPITVDNKQFSVGMRTNSTVGNFSFDRQQNRISFTVNGVSGTRGYVNATWPQSMLNGTFSVTLDGKQIPFSLKQMGLNYSLYVSYGHSQHTLTISGITIRTTTTSGASVTTTTSSTSPSPSTTSATNAIKSATVVSQRTSSTTTPQTQGSTIGQAEAFDASRYAVPIIAVAIVVALVFGIVGWRRKVAT